MCWGQGKPKNKPRGYGIEGQRCVFRASTGRKVFGFGDLENGLFDVADAPGEQSKNGHWLPFLQTLLSLKQQTLK